MDIGDANECPSPRNLDTSMLLQLSENMMNGEFEALLVEIIWKIGKS